MRKQIALFVLAMMFLCTTANTQTPTPASAPDAAAKPSAVPTTTQPGDGATERIHRAALAWFDWADGQVDKLVPAAEQLAEHIMAGGTMYVTGHPGFMDEMEYRAGGFPFTQFWPEGQKLLPNDVLLIGQFTPEDRGCKFSRLPNIIGGNGRLTGGLVIHFSSHQWPSGRLLPMIDAAKWNGNLFMIDTGAPAGDDPAAVSLGEMATTALAFALHGEAVAAATRKGKMLATWSSAADPNMNAWEAEIGKLRVLDKYKVAPVEAGKLGRQYLAICRRQVAEFLASGQAPKVRQAAERMAGRMQAGGTVWIVSDGHIHVRGSQVPVELTKVINYGRSFEFKMSPAFKPGDTLVHMAYLGYPRNSARNAVAAGGDAVILSAAEGPSDDRVISICSSWGKNDWGKPDDSVVRLPNYPVPFLPSSGVVQVPQWSSLLAEAVAAMKSRP